MNQINQIHISMQNYFIFYYVSNHTQPLPAGLLLETTRFIYKVPQNTLQEYIRKSNVPVDRSLMFTLLPLQIHSSLALNPSKLPWSPLVCSSQKGQTAPQPPSKAALPPTQTDVLLCHILWTKLCVFFLGYLLEPAFAAGIQGYIVVVSNAWGPVDRSFLLSMIHAMEGL